MPFVDDLLSERSRAWMEAQLAGQNTGDWHKKVGDSDPALRPRIAGYTILQRVGRGGMGTVYECRRDGSEARLAIKLISSGKYASDEERRRFMAEIAALLRLRHPHLCRLRDFGQDAAASWFVMDYIDGRPFHVWQAEEKPSWIRVADLIAQACRAVAHAHRQGIIHRDLNPANIMVLKDGSPVIMDFGLARDLSSDEVLTVTGSTVGTPPYMSPEQTLGTRGLVTVRSDVWGMGGVLYHALTGRPPFEGPSTHEIFTAINETEVVRPRVHAKDIPRDLERIALRCLQRDPEDRYQDLDSLATDLERFAAGRRVIVRLPGLVGRIHRRARRHPLPWTLGAALILVALGFLAFAAFEQIRRWATWTVVVDAELDHAALPVGLRARDGLLKLVEEQPVVDATGLPNVPHGDRSKAAFGWWWMDSPGLRGGSRLEFELELPIKDAIELVVDAPQTPPVEWWHHPAGWAVKVAAAEELTVAAAYLRRPGPLPSNPGYLLVRPPDAGTALHLVVEVVDTRLTVHVAGSDPVVVDDPLALGGSEHRGIGVRWFNTATRLKHLRIERLAKAELVSPLVGPDALLRHGQRDAALAEYRLLATDHQGTPLGAKALLRAYAVSSLMGDADNAEQEAIYGEIRGHEDRQIIDEADSIRAKSLWLRGESIRALGVARDLVARRPDLNPILGFLVDRTWQIDRPCGADVLALLAAAPSIGSLALPDLGITDLSPIAGRRAWSVVISNNQISDLAPLAGTGCSVLAAQRNRIESLAPIAGMTSLTTLYLADNSIADLRPLAGLTQLKSLNLAANSITSLAGLPAGIQDLILGTPPDQADSLRELNQSEPRTGGNPFSDLAGLPVGDLRLLQLSRCGVSDLAPLAGAKLLAKLDLSGTAVRDLSPLRTTALTELSLNQCPAVDLATLDLPGLQKLQLRGSAISDLSVISRHLAHLTFLDLGAGRLAAWPALPAPQLAELNLSGCPLQDLGGIASAPALKSLWLRGCGLRNLPGIVAALPLERLDLRDNALTDLGPLLQKPPPMLLLGGNPLSDACCEQLIAAGRRLGRSDLVWQGASIQAERRGDLQPLRRVAMTRGGRQVGIMLGSRPIDEATARRMAEAAGGRLRVIDGAVENQIIAETLAERILWLGVSLRDGQVLGDDGRKPAFLAPMPPMRYRGYSALPRDGGRLAMAAGGNWTICLDGKATGMVVEWDPEQ